MRDGKQAITLVRARGAEACFEAVEKLPTYTIPRTRTTKPVPRLGKLAALLRDLKLETDPVKTYRSQLVDVLRAERTRLEKDPTFMRLSNEATLLELRVHRIALAARNKGEEITTTVSAVIEDADLDLLHVDSGRALGESLHKEYLRKRVKIDGALPRMPRSNLPRCWPSTALSGG